MKRAAGLTVGAAGVLAAVSAVGLLLSGGAGASPATAGPAAAKSVAAAATALPDTRKVVIGHSVQGRPIEAVRFGDLSSPRKVLIVGNIHGDEPAGIGVVGEVKRQLRRSGRLDTLDLWLIDSVNPDGLAADTRYNAHGVDLNRNFSVGWRRSQPPSSGYYQGRRPFSEPESRAVRDLVLALRPQVSIWFHQPWAQVLAPCRGAIPLERTYSRISGVPLKRCRAEQLPGTAIRFERARLHSQAFVVELAGGRLSHGAAVRNAKAVEAVASAGTKAAAGSPRRVPLSKLKPPIKKMLIPFPPKRKREMAHYSKIHYGKAEWRLRQVKTIVEHVSATRSLQADYNTFANDVPDVEFHTLPAVCAHFVIGRDGTIYQMVPLTIRCRHVVGLNYLSIGIEHLGINDADVLSDKPEMRASFRLTRWLRCRFNVPIKYVIGHNESLSSPFYRELVPSYRGQTHGDWIPPHMNYYRHQLRALGGC